MKKIKTLFIFFAVCLFPIFSDNGLDTRNIEQRLSDILDPKIAAELAQKKEILKQKYGASNMKPEMQPVSEVNTRMSKLLYKTKPAFFAEYLRLYKKNGPKDPDVSRILRHISGLEGIEYFSNSYQAMSPLYLISYAVEEVKTDEEVIYKRIDDPFDKEMDGLEILARHVDGTFGDFIYRYQYFRNGSDMGMICLNTQKITHPWLSFVSLQPEGMLVSISVHDIGDHMLIYCSLSAKFSLVPFVGGRIKRSFSSRLTAISTWFMDEYKAAEQGIEYSAKKKNNFDN